MGDDLNMVTDIRKREIGESVGDSMLISGISVNLVRWFYVHGSLQ